MIKTSCSGPLFCERCPILRLDDPEFSDQDRFDAKNAVKLLLPRLHSWPDGLDQYGREEFELLITEELKIGNQNVATIVLEALEIQTSKHCN